MIEATAGQMPAPARVLADQAPEGTPGGEEFKLFGKDGFTFFDVLDIVNPLQHIPVISTLYRKITGDELSPAARIAGATLFTGPIGTAFALADTAVEHRTGRDMGATALAALIGDDAPEPPATIAAASPPAEPAAVEEPVALDPRFAIAPWTAPEPPARDAELALAPAPAPVTIEPPPVRRTMPPPAGDIPKGAAASLARAATRAYATSMQDVPAPALPSAHAIGEAERATAAAQNDWIVDAMARAMAKYEAIHRLQSTGAQPMQAVIR